MYLNDAGVYTVTVQHAGQSSKRELTVTSHALLLTRYLSRDISTAGTSSYAEIALEVLDPSSMELLTQDQTLREGEDALFQVKKGERGERGKRGKGVNR